VFIRIWSLILSIDLWVSIALAIPLAIVANIFTPKLQKILDARLEKSNKSQVAKKERARAEQLKSLQDEYDEIEKYHSSKDELNQLFLLSLIKVAMYGALGSIYGAIFPFLGELSNWRGIGGVFSRTGAQVTVFAISMLIFITCSRIIKIHKKVRDFESYKENTQSLIKELEQKNT
jgi:F0F1-type ATP synthase membrane subunit b/b'